MAELVPHSFNRYQLTPRESLESLILTPLQKMGIQNQIAQISDELLTLDFDPEKPKTFVQDQAYKRGQLEILRYQLIASQESESQLANFSFNQQ